VQHIDMVVSAASSALIDANAVETQVCLGPRGGAHPPTREAASSMPRRVPFCSGPLRWAG